jgi:hypothetical protein
MHELSLKTSISLKHVRDQVLLNDMALLAKHDRRTTALMLAHIAEIRRRKLYRGAGYSSMYRYLVQELGMSGDVAYKRLQAAKAACKFPGILAAIEDGRLHLTGVVLLEPHLTAENSRALLTAAVHQSTRGIKKLIAERFPKADLPTVVRPIAAGHAECTPNSVTEQGFQASPAAVLELDSNPVVASQSSGSPDAPQSLAPTPMPTYARVEPLSPQRYGVQFTIDEITHALLGDVQALLGASVPSSDIAGVFAMALECLKAKLEKQKFAQCDRPGKRRGSKNPRYVPNDIKRAVWKRDGRRCAFVGTGGKRCDAREGLELDHITPVSRGGESTLANLRLCCRAHNQYEAERVLGAEFMQGKREARKSADSESNSASSSG